MIANAMPQAIRQYSIAVAPDWSLRNFDNSCRIQDSCQRSTGLPRADAWDGILGRIGCRDVEEHDKGLIKADRHFRQVLGKPPRRRPRQTGDARVTPVLIRGQKFTSDSPRRPQMMARQSKGTEPRF